jgi:uncharacterized protein (TIGR03067 family)
MKAYWMAALTVGLLMGAGAIKDDVKKEKEKLQGTWKAVTVVERGQARADADDHRVIFDGDNFTVKKGDETIIKATFKLDPSKSPKEIDIEVAEQKSEKNNGKTAQGIYAVDGDELKLCLDEPGGSDRPKEFSAPEGTKRIFVTLKREKS